VVKILYAWYSVSFVIAYEHLILFLIHYETCPCIRCHCALYRR